MQIGQDFPLLNVSPEALAKMRTRDLSVLNQMVQVFVYEEDKNDVNSAQNGTMNLLKSMPEGNLVSARDLHILRKEFL